MGDYRESVTECDNSMIDTGTLRSFHTGWGAVRRHAALYTYVAAQRRISTHVAACIAVPCGTIYDAAQHVRRTAEHRTASGVKRLACHCFGLLCKLVKNK